jgi:hypothetical protein
LAIVPGVFLFGFAYGFKFAKIIKIIVWKVWIPRFHWTAGAVSSQWDHRIGFRSLIETAESKMKIFV